MRYYEHLVILYQFMYKILIQLVGEQTLPNIYPILSICPDRVVNVFTAQTESQHSKIATWCGKYGRKYGVQTTFAQYDPIGISMLDIQRGISGILQNELSKIQDSDDVLLILNMTGGTKLMSACAMSHCMQIPSIFPQKDKLKISITYLNPAHMDMEFVYGGKLKDDVMVRSVSDIKLSVREIIEAGGDTVVVSAHRNWDKCYAAANAIRQIAKSGVFFSMENIEYNKDMKMLDVSMSSLLKKSNAEWYEKGKQAMKQLSQKAQENEDIRQGFEVCGLEAKDGDFYFSDKLKKKINQLAAQLHISDTRYFERKRTEKEIRSKIQSAMNFFVGGWWEVIVANAYKMQNPTSEVLWSVETASAKDRLHPVETDIIASDGKTLCCISCKRGVHANVTQELEQHCARTAMLAGIIHNRIIAVYQKDAVYKLKYLVEALHLKMWTDVYVLKIEQGETVKPEDVSASKIVSGIDEEKTRKESTADKVKHSLLQRIAEFFASMLTRKK